MPLYLLVLLFAVAFILLGYFFMDKVDKFIEDGDIRLRDPYKEYCNGYKIHDNVILIYGKNDFSKLVIALCESKGYSYVAISESEQINKDLNYICLLALSYNDADNLMISSIGLKIYSIPKTVAMCNNKDYLKVYKEFPLERILLQEEGRQRLLGAIEEFLEETAAKGVK